MAARFWVGGSGTWDGSSTANWASSSGGASGASAPTAADTVTFDANSGAGTCTTAAGATCLTATLNTSTLDLTLGDDLTAAGSFTLTLGTLNLSSYTLSCTVFSSNNSNIRVIAFGTGNITLTGNNGTIWSMQNAANFSYTGTSQVNCTYSGSTGTRTINHNTGGTVTLREEKAVNFNITAGTDTISTVTITFATSINSLNFTGFSGTLSQTPIEVYGNLTYSAGMTLSSGTSSTIFVKSSGTQTVTTNGKTLDFPVIKNNAGILQLLDNLTLGSTRSFTHNTGTVDLNNNTLTAGIYSSNNSNSRAIAFGATGSIVLVGNGATIWNFQNAENFSYTGLSRVDCTYAGATGTRTINHNTGGTVTLREEKAINFNITAGTDTVNTVTITFGTSFNNLDFTGFAGTLANAARELFGNLTYSAGMTLSAGNNVTSFFKTSGTQILTSNNKTLDFPITKSNAGTLQCADSLTMGATRNFTFTDGTVLLKDGETSTVGAFVTSGSTQKFLASTLSGSQATLSQASGTVNATNLTIKDINATGGATWNAFVTNGNVDAGNNDGWDFFVQLGRYIYTRRKNKVIFQS